MVAVTMHMSPGDPGFSAEHAALRQRLDRAEALLRKFAAKADLWEGNHPVRSGTYSHRDATQVSHRLGDFRAARDFLKEAR